MEAEKFGERFDEEPTEVVFTLKHGQRVTRDFRPDTAGWFRVRPATGP